MGDEPGSFGCSAATREALGSFAAVSRDGGSSYGLMGILRRVTAFMVRECITGLCGCFGGAALCETDARWVLGVVLR